MADFYKNNRKIINQKLEELVPSDEKIIWNSKPHYDSYTINELFTGLWLFPMVWAMLNGNFIRESYDYFIFVKGFEIDFFFLFYVFYCILRLLPIWLSIIYIFTYGIRWKKEEYLCTNERIYKISGLLIPRVSIVELNKIKQVNQENRKTYSIFGTSDIQIIFDEHLPIVFHDIKGDSIKVYLEEQILKNSEEYKKNMEK